MDTNELERLIREYPTFAWAIFGQVRQEWLQALGDSVAQLNSRVDTINKLVDRLACFAGDIDRRLQAIDQRVRDLEDLHPGRGWGDQNGTPGEWDS